MTGVGGRDRDAALGRSLRALDVPEHRPGFWDELDESLALGSNAGPGSSPAPRVGLVPPVGRRRRRLLVPAAGAVALGSVLTAALLARPSTTVQVRQAPPAATAATAAPAPTPTADPSAPEQVAREWVRAVGAGDFERAWALTAPQSQAAVGGFEEFAGDAPELTERWGEWGAPEVRASATGRVASSASSAGAPAGASELAVVALERGDGRAEAVVLRSDAGGTRVEPFLDVAQATFRPEPGSRIDAAQPVELELSVQPDTVTVLVDGREVPSPTPVPTGVGTSVVSFVLPPPQTPGPRHVVVLAVVGGDAEAFATSYDPQP